MITIVSGRAVRYNVITTVNFTVCIINALLLYREETESVKPLYHTAVTLVFITWAGGTLDDGTELHSPPRTVQTKTYYTATNLRYHNYPMLVKHC